MSAMENKTGTGAPQLGDRGLRLLRHWVRRGWGPWLRGAVSIFGLILGALVVESHSVLVGLVFILGYIAFYVMFEDFLARESIDTEQRSLMTTVADMELYWMGEQRLSLRLGTITEAILLIGQATTAENRELQTAIMKREASIDDTLRDLCDALTAAASRTTGIARTAFWFRATFMEVKPCRQVGTDELGNAKYQPVLEPFTQNQTELRLVYVGWYTPNGQPPESMSRGITLGKGEGTAGEAWDDRKPVIEHEFKDRRTSADSGSEARRGWVDNYPGQGKKYKSMICVPVFKGTRNLAGEVIGIITIDTRVEGFFGQKGQKENEDKYSGIVLPYATYIAFITAVNDVLESIRKVSQAPLTKAEIGE